MHHAINWFEIPSEDFTRAVQFYNTILDTTLRQETFFGVPNAIFPTGEANVGGAVIHQAERQPGNRGSLIYLNVTGQFDAVLSRVNAAGGQVVTPKIDLGPVGTMATILDSEGNHIGLHSPNNE